MNPLTFNLEDEFPALSKLEPDLDRLVEALTLLRELKEDMGTEAHPQYWSEAEGGHLFGIVWMSLVCVTADTPEVRKDMGLREKARHLESLSRAYEVLRYWWEVLGPYAYRNDGPRGDGVIKTGTWERVCDFFLQIAPDRIRIDAGNQGEGVTFQVHPKSQHLVEEGSPKSIFVATDPRSLPGSSILKLVAWMLIGRPVLPGAYEIRDPRRDGAPFGSG